MISLSDILKESKIELNVKELLNLAKRLNKRIPKLEKRIINNSQYYREKYSYLENIIKDRWPELEEIIYTGSALMKTKRQKLERYDYERFLKGIGYSKDKIEQIRNEHRIKK